MPSFIFNRGKYLLTTGGVIFTTDVLRVMLMGSTYTPNKDSNFVSDISSAEVADASYTRKTIGSPTATEDDANDLVKFDCTDVEWTGLTITTPVDGQAIGAVVYKQTGGNDASPTDDALIAWYEFDSPQTCTGADFTLRINVNGLITAEDA